MALSIGSRHPRFAAVMGDLAGGLSGGITSVPGNIAVGFVALAPLGGGAQGEGLGLALLAAAIGGGLFTLFCRTRGLMAGGSMSFALVVAGVLTTLFRQGELQAGLAGLPAALAVVALLTLLTALFEAALAATGLGQTVTMLPYPVVSGIRNGVAVLMVVVQLRPMLGVTWEDGILRWPHPGALAVSAVTLLLMLRPIRRLRLVPPALIGLAAGAGVHHLLANLLMMRGGAELLGPLLNVPPGGVQHLRTLLAGWAALPGLSIPALFATLAPAALTIAVVSTLETLVGASVMQDITGEHGSSRADLFALAIANCGGGLCGTLPVTGGSPGSMAVWSAGGRGEIAGWTRAVVLLAVVLLAGPVVALLPTAALASMVVSSGLQNFDREVLRLTRRLFSAKFPGRLDMAGNLLVTFAVITAAIVFSLVAAVATGLLLSTALFVIGMSGRAVRRRYRNVGSRSRTFRSDEEAETLLRFGAEIEVIELHGALFFGSADQVARTIETAWQQGARCLVLDVQRVSQIDLSGARRLLQVTTQHWTSGAFLALAGLRLGSPVLTCYDALGLRVQLREDRIFATLEEALAAAELVLLACHDVSRHRSVAPTDILVMFGFLESQAATLLTYATEHAYRAGGAVIRAGERADALFFLLEGEVDVSLPLVEGARARLATLTAGTLFGEAALLSDALRSADVTAITPVRCLSLNVATIAALRDTSPDLAYRLMAAVAGQLAQSLTMANVGLRSAGE